MAQRLQRAVEVSCRSLHRPHDAYGALEQIGSADVAHEEEVAAEESHRQLARRLVGDDERQVLRRVTGRVANVETYAAE